MFVWICSLSPGLDTVCISNAVLNQPSSFILKSHLLCLTSCPPNLPCASWWSWTDLTTVSSNEKHWAISRKYFRTIIIFSGCDQLRQLESKTAVPRVTSQLGWCESWAAKQCNKTVMLKILLCVDEFTWYVLQKPKMSGSSKHNVDYTCSGGVPKKSLRENKHMSAPNNICFKVDHVIYQTQQRFTNWREMSCTPRVMCYSLNNYNIIEKDTLPNTDDALRQWFSNYFKHWKNSGPTALKFCKSELEVNLIASTKSYLSFFNKR